MNNLNKQQKEPTTLLDIRCSSACARAAITALILSAIALSMIQPIKELLALNALVKYTFLREQLRIELDELENDFNWKSLQDSKFGIQAVMEWSIAKLLEYECKDPPTEPKEKSTTETPDINQTKLKEKKPIISIPDDVPPSAPSVPKGFGVVRRLYNIRKISSILFELGNLEMIRLARSASYMSNIQIYNWELLRYRILQENTGLIPVGKGISTFRSDQSPPKFYTEDRTYFNRDTLLEYLTLHNVRELSNYRFPDTKDLDLSIRDRAKFILPSLKQPIAFTSAIIFIEFGIALSVLYFWVYQREAQSSNTYPAPGTMFGVFSRTYLTKLIFLILSVLPLAASVLLAIYATPLTYISIVFAVLVSIFSVLIVKESNMIKLK